MSAHLARLLELEERTAREIAAERRRIATLDRHQAEQFDQMLRAIPAADVRAWADEQGYAYPLSGRLSRALRLAYYEAQEVDQ